MNVTELYRMLCALYGRWEAPAIERYLIREVRPGEPSARAGSALGREALIIRQRGDDVELGLYLDPQVTDAIGSGDPLDELDALSCAIEGASHFLYAADRAARERQLSRLELELQGEVDKFLIIHILASEAEGFASPDLFARQFERHRYGAGLDAADIERYDAANHFAAKYCAGLRANYFNPLRPRGLIASARDFFERGLAGKLKLLIP